MSRSRKNVSCFSDYSRNYNWWAKRQASKAVRRFNGEIKNGKSYRKVFCSYDICDYKFLNFDINDDWYERGKRK